MCWVIFFIVVILLFGSSSSINSDTKVNREYRDDSSKKFDSDKESVSNRKVSNKSLDDMKAERETKIKTVDESRNMRSDKEKVRNKEINNFQRKKREELNNQISGGSFTFLKTLSEDIEKYAKIKRTADSLLQTYKNDNKEIIYHFELCASLVNKALEKDKNIKSVADYCIYKLSLMREQQKLNNNETLNYLALRTDRKESLYAYFPPISKSLFKDVDIRILTSVDEEVKKEILKILNELNTENKCKLIDILKDMVGHKKVLFDEFLDDMGEKELFYNYARKYGIRE